MKKIYVSEVTVKKLKEFNKAKGKGIHQPFITANFMSKGTRCIFWCPVQERVIQVMSQGEMRKYFDLIFQNDVVKIEEQYPLDYVVTRRIAKSLRIIHPRDDVTGELKVMTSDLVVTRADKYRKHYREVYSIKDEVEPRKRARIKQKLKIEKAYWRKYGVVVKFFVSADLDLIEAANIKRLSDYFDKTFSVSELQHFTTVFVETVACYPSDNLKETLLRVSFTEQQHSQYIYRLFATSVLKRILAINLQLPVELFEPIHLVA